MVDFAQFAPVIINGFILTVEVTLVGIFAGLVFGILLAIGDIYGGRAVSTAIRIYVEFFRGSPLLVQLLVAQYAIPAITHIPIDPYVTAFVVFALNSAGYQKGYIKGAMETVSKDQMDAGLSVGMSRVKTIFYVILPQALRIVIPAWSNEFCSLTKSTAALSLIGIKDLTAAGWTMIGITYSVLPSWIIIAAIYLAWITAFTKVTDIVYEKKKIPGIEISVQ
jgi:polar amino acid transport system permease protein